MLSKTVMSLGFVAGCALALGATIPAAQAQSSPPQLVTNGPQASPGDDAGWSAHRDVIESRRYDRLLRTNLAFRHARMRKECGPIDDPQLHERCLASFQQHEPVMVGTAQRPTRSREREVDGR